MWDEKGTDYTGLLSKKSKFFSNAVPEHFRQEIGKSNRIKQDTGVENKLIKEHSSSLFTPSSSWVLEVTENPREMMYS